MILGNFTCEPQSTGWFATFCFLKYELPNLKKKNKNKHKINENSLKYCIGLAKNIMILHKMILHAAYINLQSFIKLSKYNLCRWQYKGAGLIKKEPF